MGPRGCGESDGTLCYLGKFAKTEARRTSDEDKQGQTESAKDEEPVEGNNGAGGPGPFEDGCGPRGDPDHSPKRASERRKSSKIMLVPLGGPTRPNKLSRSGAGSLLHVPP